MRVVSYLPTPACTILDARLPPLSCHRASKRPVHWRTYPQRGTIEADFPCIKRGVKAAALRELPSRRNASQGPLSPPLQRYFHHKYENNDGYKPRPHAADNVDDRA